MESIGKGICLYWSLMAWCIVFTPFAQWASLRYRNLSGWGPAGYFGAVVASWTFVGLYHHMLIRSLGPALYAYLGVAFILVQSLYWRTLKRHYARADLI